MIKCHTKADNCKAFWSHQSWLTVVDSRFFLTFVRLQFSHDSNYKFDSIPFLALFKQRQHGKNHQTFHPRLLEEQSLRNRLQTSRIDGIPARPVGEFQVVFHLRAQPAAGSSPRVLLYFRAFRRCSGCFYVLTRVCVAAGLRVEGLRLLL